MPVDGKQLFVETERFSVSDLGMDISTINSLCVVRVEARCQIADPITIEMSTSNQIRLTQRRSQYWTDGGLYIVSYLATKE